MAKFAVLQTINITLKFWAAALSKGLTFDDNVKGYEWTGQIVAGAEQQITHNLGLIPSRFIVSAADGSNSIVRGVLKKANGKFFYVKNVASTSTFMGKILILP